MPEVIFAPAVAAVVPVEEFTMFMAIMAVLTVITATVMVMDFTVIMVVGTLG